MNQPIKPPTKVSLWSSNMSDAERLVHERLLLVFKEANETFNGEMLGKYLSDDVKYTAQHIAEDMEGKNKIAQYLIDRYKFFEEKLHLINLTNIDIYKHYIGGIIKLLELFYQNQLDVLE